MRRTPTRTIVIDASAMVALIVDAGTLGEWIASHMQGSNAAAPSLVLFEAANILRRQQLRGDLDSSAASLAHADLVQFPISLFPYEVMAERAWELRTNLTAYDATYVALAELLQSPLITLDKAIGRASGVRCAVLTA